MLRSNASMTAASLKVGDMGEVGNDILAECCCAAVDCTKSRRLRCAAAGIYAPDIISITITPSKRHCSS